MFNKILVLALIATSFLFGSLKQQTTTVQNITKDSATIGIGNLTTGQSGVIVHNFDDAKSIIIADFEVVSSSVNSSKVKFKYTNFENKVAIPTPNIEVKNGNTAILNHMYNTSILITPNFESFELVSKNFTEQNFLHSDIFGAYLKSHNRPVPTKEDFVNFCNKHNIGTMFFVLNGMIYVLDSKTFAVLEEYKVKKDIKDSSFMTPFYTNVEDIKLGIFSFGDKNIGDYNSYYKKLLGL